MIPRFYLFLKITNVTSLTGRVFLAGLGAG